VFAAVLVLGAVPVALASGGLSGKYQTVIKHSTALGGFLNGKWVINFKSSNDTYRVTKNGALITTGKNTFKRNVVTFKDSSGPGACPTKGKYSYTLSGKTLTFKKISDSASGNCVGRQDVLKHALSRSRSTGTRRTTTA
jgi:hypothetical protein